MSLVALGIGIACIPGALASCVSCHNPHRIAYYNSGTLTATGEYFVKQGFTVAVAERSMLHKWYRFESNGRVVYAYANDIIGPAGRKKGMRYELSEGAFRRLIPPGVDPYDIGVLDAIVTEAI